jgi:topoisomerase-4 subunit A
VAEIVYNKLRGKEQQPNEEIELEEFISIKGIAAQGNMLTKEKVKQINLLDPLPYEEPEVEEVEVVEEDNEEDEENPNPTADSQKDNASGDEDDDDLPIDDKGQASLF